MPSLIQLFTIAAVTAVTSASLLPDAVSRLAVQAHCTNPKVVHSATISVGDKPVQLTSLSCAAKSARRDLFSSSPFCYIFGSCVHHPTPVNPPGNVCGTNCITSCNNNVGVLPPVSEDCDTIEAAIQIFQNNMAVTFTVDANHVQTLTHKTCNYFFSNSGRKPLEACWSDLSAKASAAGSACFPPVHPFSSEGLCSADDGTWAVGASHS